MISNCFNNMKMMDFATFLQCIEINDLYFLHACYESSKYSCSSTNKSSPSAPLV